MRATHAAALTLVLAFAAPAAAQARPAFFDEPCRVVAVGTPQPGQRYPLFVMLPPTGDASDWIAPYVQAAIPLDTYYVMLTPGAPLRSDYSPHFGAYLGWVDARVLPDLDHALATLPIDPEEVYATGFSLGGDVSWALVVRHPDRFRGALVMGSRSTAGAARGAADTLARRHARIAFTMGNDDDAGRQRGIERASRWAERAGITTRLFRFEGVHQVPPPDVLREAVRLMLGR
jgi:pimeloyl-ACP methyl ester carboxylesterase